MNTLLIIDKEAGIYASALEKELLPELRIEVAQSPIEVPTAALKANIILGQPALIAPLLTKTDRLQWVQSTFAGVEPLCIDGLRRDYLLTGVKNIFGSMMSEYVFGHILARERHLLATRRNQEEKVWISIPYRSLSNLTMGIIGLGSIGRHVAATANHFGMRVLGMKRTPGVVEFTEHVYIEHERDDFLPQLDYLVSILPDTPQTRRFLRLEDFQKMKPSAVLINIGRGTVIERGALIKALEQEYITGAILDVFEEEPLPLENPLWQMPQVTITPHNAAVSFPEKIVEIFCDNYQRFIDHRSLKYIIDIDRGY